MVGRSTDGENMLLFDGLGIDEPKTRDDVYRWMLKTYNEERPPGAPELTFEAFVSGGTRMRTAVYRIDFAKIEQARKEIEET